MYSFLNAFLAAFKQILLFGLVFSIWLTENEINYLDNVHNNYYCRLPLDQRAHTYANSGNFEAIKVTLNLHQPFQTKY